MLGQTDPGLSEAGRAACQALDVPARVFYTSPLKRATESAAILSQGREVVVLPQLAEIALGEWDGRSWADIEIEYPALARDKLADWMKVTPPGGERWSDFRERIGGAIQTIRVGPFPAAVVGHVGVNSVIDSLLTGGNPLTFQQACASLLTYEL